MYATDILEDEHRVIEQMLSCLEMIIERANASGMLKEEPAKEAVEFFRIFVDRCHQRKEDAHLFPLMQARGMTRSSGPISVVRCEHELARLHLDGMAGAVQWASKGDANVLQRFVQHAQSYIRLVREHMRSEDHHFFPSANRVFNEFDQQNLLTNFEDVEAKELGAGTHERYVGLVNRLTASLGVSRPASKSRQGEHKWTLGRAGRHPGSRVNAVNQGTSDLQGYARENGRLRP